MRGKYIILTSIILLLLFIFAACQNTKKEELFKQDPEDQTLAQATAAPAVQDLAEAFSHVDTEEDAEEENGSAENDIDNEQQEAFMETFEDNISEAFCYEEITDEVKARIRGKSHGENCKIPYEDLRYVRVLHWGFDKQVHSGELIVNKAIAQDIADIFKELFELKYPIEQMVLVDKYDADDNSSMAENNSSAFNYRVVEGTSRISMHGYGLAIDINPLYNPYIHKVGGKTAVSPENGAMYEDRTLDCEYYIDTEDECYKAFTKRGFTWGGDWKNSKDYQHFQKEIPSE